MSEARSRIVALLDTMWGVRKTRAPRYFRINPHNHSGRRLYRLVGAECALLVTNCCPIMQTSARDHGVPDATYVAENLRRLEPFALLLVCGAVAQRTYAASGYNSPTGRVLLLKHPAARTWTKTEITEKAELIRSLLDVQL